MVDRTQDNAATPLATLPAEHASEPVSAVLRAANGIPERTYDPIAKAKRRPESLRAAINAKCWDCVGAGQDPNPRGAIRTCTCSRCPLWAVRPYRQEPASE